MHHPLPALKRCWTWLSPALMTAVAAGCMGMPKKSGEALGQSPPPPAATAADASEDDGVEQASFEQEEIETPADKFNKLVDLKSWPKNFKKLIGQGPDRQIARGLYKEADILYREAAATEGADRATKFAEAGATFAQAAERWPDSALEQDALYMAGEAYFFADYYPDANRQYEMLIKAYPNNRYLDTVDKRRFAIAQYWVDLNRKNPEALYYFNLTDNTRPWKDVRGNALRVYDKIRVDDPTGKLADDATLAAANENFAARKFLKADEYYTDLIKTYPSSEHQFTAHFLGLKAKLSAYLGPNYTSASLDEAEKLIKQMRRQFPSDSTREREFLDRAMAEIRFKKAEKLMTFGRFYDKRAEYRAAAHYYNRALAEYNDTPFARKAEERLAQIGDKPAIPAQKAQWLVNLFPETDKVKPLLEATRKYDEQNLQNEQSGETMIAQPPQQELQR